MNSDVYLLLYQISGSYKKIEANKATAAMVLKDLLKGMVIGDSIDAPFMGFIRVQDVKHEISLSGSASSLEWGELAEQKLSEGEGQLLTRGRELIRGARETSGPMKLRIPDRAKQRRIEAAYHEAISQHRNAFANSHLPEQGVFEFDKYVDRATPQLAYACSVQARFPLALFFFRKKVGLGVEGIRQPYLTVGLRKVRISGYSMNGDKETIKLKYGDIAWAALGQVADSNLPFPVPSARMYDCEAKRGGELYDGGWAYAVQVIGAAMTIAASAAVTAIGASRGDGSYSS